MTKPKKAALPKASKQLLRAFEVFREQCIWLTTCFDTFRVLFETRHRPKRLLQRAAPGFFEELNHVLAEYCRLQACRITDPPSKTFWKGKGKARVPVTVESLTVENINEALDKEGLLVPPIPRASRSVMRYRRFVVRSRNKVIGHADKATILRGRSIGRHPAREVDKFLTALHAYNNAVGNVVGSPLAFEGSSGPGDALDLLKVLRTGLVAKRVERCSERRARRRRQGTA